MLTRAIMQEKLLDKQMNLVNRGPFSPAPSLPLTPLLMKISPTITTLSARWKLNDSIAQMTAFLSGEVLGSCILLVKYCSK